MAAKQMNGQLHVAVDTQQPSWIVDSELLKFRLHAMCLMMLHHDAQVLVLVNTAVALPVNAGERQVRS